VHTRYAATDATLALSGHGIKIEFPKGMTFESGGKIFDLVQFHLHTPSEHAFDGQRRPMVIHFVHASDDGKLAVLGVTFKEGKADRALGAVLDAVERGDGAKLALDLNELVPADLKVYRYMGSLTTPPCSEGVHWHVASQPLEASAEQIAAFHKLLGDSARSLQPLGDRLLVAPAE